MAIPASVAAVLYVLSVARLSTLLTHDEITRPAREWLIYQFDPGSRIQTAAVYLLGAPDGHAYGCPWCLSIWIAAATAYPMWAWWPHPGISVPVLALAASQVTGMIFRIGR